MFGKGKNTSSGSSSERFDTIIANNTSISGNINADGNVRIDGNYKGDIISNSEVIIGDNGFVEGNVKARGISVSGKVEGNIECEGLLEIYSHGVVQGDIIVKSLSVVEGGILDGKCKMNCIQSSESGYDRENESIEIMED